MRNWTCSPMRDFPRPEQPARVGSLPPLTPVRRFAFVGQQHFPRQEGTVALRRLFSFVLLSFALFGAGSGTHEATSVLGPAGPMVLRAAHLSAPSPFLGAPVRTDADVARLPGLGSGGRLPPRSIDGPGTRPIADVAALDPRVSAADASLLDIIDRLARARTGERSAHGTSLPPPHTA